MIAITDTSAFSELEFIETNPPILPTIAQIETLIGSADFVNTTITTTFKTLLIRVVTDAANNFYLYSYMDRIYFLFHRIGFYYEDNNLLFTINEDALDIGTEIIINELNDYTHFRDIAYNAFHDNSWAQEANNIRAMEDSGLQKLHYITVYSNFNANTQFNYNDDILNQENIINLRNENTERFLMIDLDANVDPEMPTVRIHNYSDVRLNIRLKIEYENYVNFEVERGGNFGSDIPHDNDANGIIEANEIVNLNRNFVDFFPNQDNAERTENETYTIELDSDDFWDVNFDDRIRGGEAIFEFIPEPQNPISWGQGVHHHFKFHIRGKNPTYQQVDSYLTNQNYSQRIWFMIRKLRQESGSVRDFNGISQQNDNYEFRHFDRVENINQYNLRLNSDDGLPVFGFPRGYGMSQLDNFDRLSIQDIENIGLTEELANIQPEEVNELQTILDQQERTIDFSRRIVASDQEVWHWKENINKGFSFLVNEKMNTTINKIVTIRSRVIDWNNAHPTDLVVIPPPEFYNSVIYTWTASDIAELLPYNNLFNQGTPPIITNQENRELKSFFDAMLIKTYNGLGNPVRHFVEINPESSDPSIKPALTIYNSTTSNPYYVRNLSNRYD